MAFPTEPDEPILEIATEENYTAPGDAWDGEPTKVVPSSGVQAQGYIPGTPRPAEYDNWLFSAFAKWLAYFRAFVVELLTYIVDGEWTYPTPKTRTVLVPFSQSMGRTSSTGVPHWAEVEGVASYGISQAARAKRWWGLCGIVPPGAVITGVRVLVQPEANHTSTDRMSFRIDRFAVSGATIASAFSFGPFYDSGGSGADEWIPSGAITLNAVAGTFIEVEVTTSIETGDDTVLLLEVTYTDPGPRNAA